MNLRFNFLIIFIIPYHPYYSYHLLCVKLINYPHLLLGGQDAFLSLFHRKALEVQWDGIFHAASHSLWLTQNWTQLFPALAQYQKQREIFPTLCKFGRWLCQCHVSTLISQKTGVCDKCWLCYRCPAHLKRIQSSRSAAAGCWQPHHSVSKELCSNPVWNPLSITVLWSTSYSQFGWNKLTETHPSTEHTLAAQKSHLFCELGTWPIPVHMWHEIPA